MKKIYLILTMFLSMFINQAHAQSTPDLWVTSINFENKEYAIGDTVNGTFSIKNLSSDIDALEIYYEISLGRISRSETNVSPELKQTELVGPYMIRRDSSKDIAFSFELKDVLDGDLGLKVQLVQKDGTILSRDAERITVDKEDGAIKKTIDGNFYLEGEFFPLNSGPTVSKDREMYLLFDTDDLPENVSVQIFERSYLGEKVFEGTVPVEDVTIADTVFKAISLPKDIKPKVYVGKIKFDDETKELEFKYIIKGEQIEIIKAAASKPELIQGEDFSVFMEISGEPLDYLEEEFNSGPSEVRVKIELTNESGDLIANLDKVTPVNLEAGNIENLKFDFTSATKAKEVALKVELYNTKTGELYTTYTTVIKDDTTEEETELPLIVYITSLGLSILLLLIILKLKNKKVVPIVSIVLLLSIFAGLSVYSKINLVSAAYDSLPTTQKLSDYGVQAIGIGWERFGGKIASYDKDIITTSTGSQTNLLRIRQKIYSPMPPQIKGYKPGEVVWIDGDVSYNHCTNDGWGHFTFFTPDVNDTTWHSFKGPSTGITDQIREKIKGYNGWLDSAIYVRGGGGSERVWKTLSISTGSGVSSEEELNKIILGAKAYTIYASLLAKKNAGTITVKEQKTLTSLQATIDAYYVNGGDQTNSAYKVTMPSQPGVYYMPVKTQTITKSAKLNFFQVTYQQVCVLGAGLCVGEVIPACPNLPGTYTQVEGVVYDSTGQVSKYILKSDGTCIENMCHPAVPPVNYGEICGCVATRKTGTIGCSGLCVNSMGKEIPADCGFSASCAAVTSPVTIGNPVAINSTVFSAPNPLDIRYDWKYRAQTLGTGKNLSYTFNNIDSYRVSLEVRSGTEIARTSCIASVYCDNSHTAGTFCENGINHTYVCTNTGWQETTGGACSTTGGNGGGTGGGNPTLQSFKFSPNIANSISKQCNYELIVNNVTSCSLTNRIGNPTTILATSGAINIEGVLSIGTYTLKCLALDGVTQTAVLATDSCYSNSEIKEN